MPSAAYATLCKDVVRKQRDFWRLLGATQLLCVARSCGRRARKWHGGASQLYTPFFNGAWETLSPPCLRMNWHGAA